MVTTGTFTIPLMKRVGFPGTKAGAVEVAASTNGQLTPPIMGAAAFLMVEYVGISYVEVIKHAFLPAIISYIALVYIVHLEAMKAGMKGLPRASEPTPLMKFLIMLAFGIALVCGLALATYYGIGWINDVADEQSGWIIAALLTLVYVAIIKFCATYPDLELDDPNAPIVSLPATVVTSQS